ncbi:unnamed protein product, partial [Urochloa humidicola]
DLRDDLALTSPPDPPLPVPVPVPAAAELPLLPTADRPTLTLGNAAAPYRLHPQRAVRPRAPPSSMLCVARAPEGRVVLHPPTARPSPLSSSSSLALIFSPLFFVLADPDLGRAGHGGG